ncbi:MAG: hypothetical protein LBQ66_05770 [Planctomycetaceae bacterium]|jgi:hypothetical protein|nr:hypothetical protein [Planctomycetaceae bacterium]
MSELGIFDFLGFGNNPKHQAYLERQARREANHHAYLERQARREASHRDYLERQAKRERRQAAWEAKREANRQAFFERVTNNVARLREQYEQRLANLQQQGLEQYLPNEFASIRAQIDELDMLLQDDDPESARDLSMQIGQEISQLSAIAREAKREFDIKEQQRQQELAAMKQQATTELAQFIQSQLNEVNDPIERDFAFNELKKIRNEFLGRSVNTKELNEIKIDVLRRVETIRKNAAEQATAWKERKQKETQKESQQEFIQQMKQNIETDRNIIPADIQKVLAQLDALNQSTLTNEEMQASITETTEAVDEAVADETVRREVVKAVYESLNKTGFIVTNPKREQNGKDEVVIRATKPAGSQAQFKVTLDGHLEYKFDNYEGSKCKTDIKNVTDLLQDVYGIELSHKRVLWENPDKIAKSSKNLPTDGNVWTTEK